MHPEHRVDRGEIEMNHREGSPRPSLTDRQELIDIVIRSLPLTHIRILLSAYQKNSKLQGLGSYTPAEQPVPGLRRQIPLFSRMETSRLPEPHNGPVQKAPQSRIWSEFLCFYLCEWHALSQNPQSIVTDEGEFSFSTVSTCSTRRS